MKQLIFALLLYSYTALSLALISTNSVDLPSKELTAQSSKDENQLTLETVVSTANLEHALKIKKQEAALTAFYLSVRYAAKNDLEKAKKFILQAIQLQPDNTGK